MGFWEIGGDRPMRVEAFEFSDVALKCFPVGLGGRGG